MGIHVNHNKIVVVNDPDGTKVDHIIDEGDGILGNLPPDPPLSIVEKPEEKKDDQKNDDV